MALFGLFGSTASLVGQYDGRESATARNRRKAESKAAAGRPGRLAGHRSRGIRRAADQGQAWEEADRKRIG
jgi:hypothetical protein